MTERTARRQRLGTRLGVAFVVVAVGAVAVATALALTATVQRFDRLVEEQRDQVVADVVVAVTTAYAAADGWDSADLLPAHTLAASAGAVLVVETATGATMPPPQGMEDLREQLQRGRTDRGEGDGGRGDQSGGRGARARAASPVALSVAAEDPGEVSIEQERSAPVVADGETVGWVTLLFTSQDSLDPGPSFRRALTRNLLLAGGAAALLGLAVTMWVTPRLTRPLRRLTDAVDRIAHGDRAGRVPPDGTVHELAVLALSVNRMADDLQREDRLRRALVADVAHEVRTPLSILLGEVEALLDGVVQPTSDRLASLYEEVLRLARLIDDLDTIAEVEAAGMELERRLVDLSVVARSALSGLADLLDAQDIRVDVDLVPVMVHGDTQRLEQVVRNLLTNAARFSPSGGTISVEVARDGAEAVLAVTDDGPGVPPDELPHVFERFWRGRRAQGTPGSGVGLAVVAALSAAHGGRVEVENVDGRGARFTVRVPRPSDGSGVPPSPVAADQHEGQSTGQGRHRQDSQPEDRGTRTG